MGITQEFENAYRRIRYVSLQFTVEMTEDTRLPKYKVSALRGGIGEMLLRMHCIRDRNCEACAFREECIVQRILSPKMALLPPFMSGGAGVGYVIECEDARTDFRKGDCLTFRLLLFGRVLVYFSTILQAIYMLGNAGLGKYRSTFRLTGIRNSTQEPIMEGLDIRMKYYKAERIGDYVDRRVARLLSPLTCSDLFVRFASPATIKYQKQFIRRFSPEAVLDAVLRRLFILCCFEGISADMPRTEDYSMPAMHAEAHRPVRVPRYSSHKKQKMVLNGIVGSMQLADVDEEFLSLMIAGELVHIGKNTSFGFGRYELAPVRT